MSSFGERLKQLLKDNKVSQQWLADLLKVHKNTVYFWVNDKREPNLPTLRFISHFMDVDYTWLITGETPIQYAQRRDARKQILKISDSKEKYLTEDQKDLEDLVSKIFKLNREEFELVKNLVDRLNKSEGKG